MSEPKFEIGQRVRVAHRTCGEWEGEVTWRNQVENLWEYEVSNSPQDLSKFDAFYLSRPGYRWYPLAWEHELTPVRMVECYCGDHFPAGGSCPNCSADEQLLEEIAKEL